MKRNAYFLAALLGASLFSNATFAAEYLVKYKNMNAIQALDVLSENKSNQIKVTGHHAVGQLVKVDIAERASARTLAKIMSDSNVEYVVPNFQIRAFNTPVDMAALKEQWAMAKIGAEKAWQRAGNKGNRNVIVAVIDTGVDYRHSNLAPNAVPGFNFKDNNADPMDKTSAQNPGHGTHCAGVIGATGLVDGGIVGMSPEVSIMPLRFLGEDGSGSLENGIKAIDYAIEKGAQVISASWGATVPRSQAQPLIEAVKRASDKGVIFVAAAANDGKNNDVTEVFPANANFDNTITVAASTSSDAKPSWSNYGTATVHVAAPGENIMSTLPGNKYGNLSGTSMATPLVSGLVAFLKSQDPSLSGAQIRALLQTTGAKVNIQTACNCRIDAFNAVDALLKKDMWVVPAAASVAVNDKIDFSVVNGSAPFKFESSNPSVATVSSNGQLAAVADGSAVIKVTDASGKVAQTLNINVGKKSSNTPPPDNGGGGGGGGEECPIGNPQLCEIICGIQPDLPFCKK